MTFFTRAVLVSLITLASVGCGAANGPVDDESLAQSASDLNTPDPVTFLPAKRIAANLTGGVGHASPTEAEALSEALASSEARKEAELQTCASDFGVARADVDGSFQACQLSVTQGQGGFWGHYDCGHAYCVAGSLANHERVVFDGTTLTGAFEEAKSVSGRPLKRGQLLVLDLDTAKMADALSTYTLPAGEIALIPHLMVRTRQGSAFVEAPLRNRAPPSFSFPELMMRTNIGSRLAAIQVPADAKVLQLYLRFERFAYDSGSFQSEAVFQVHYRRQVADGFFSNFGRNFTHWYR